MREKRVFDTNLSLFACKWETQTELEHIWVILLSHCLLQQLVFPCGQPFLYWPESMLLNVVIRELVLQPDMSVSLCIKKIPLIIYTFLYWIYFRCINKQMFDLIYKIYFLSIFIIWIDDIYTELTRFIFSVNIITFWILQQHRK